MSHAGEPIVFSSERMGRAVALVLPGAERADEHQAAHALPAGADLPRVVLGVPASRQTSGSAVMSHKHLHLLQTIFHDPVSANIHWREIESLLTHLGAEVEAAHGARIRVVLNRVDHPSFPNSISGVIYQSGAFSCIDDGQFWEPVSDSAYRAAKEAMAGSDPSGGAIYYFNPAKATSKWIWSRPLIVIIGDHRFCS